MNDWLTNKELVNELGCHINWPSKLLGRGEIPPELYKRNGSKHLMFHKSIIPILKKKYQYWNNSKYEDVQPADAVPYDGYILRPSEIAILEGIRRKNGYRAMHYTNLSLTELIAMGGDKQNNYANY